MNTPLFESLGLGSHELVAIVGAGGKTTILRTLGAELSEAGRKVILTTTTKMAPEQVADKVIRSHDPAEVERLLAPDTPLFVLGGETHNRVTGPPPEAIDQLFSSTTTDHIIVEADGARTKSIKAPAEHEPVIPTATTTVIVVIGADAFGQPFESVAHRLDRIAALTGCHADDIVTPETAAAILLHPQGGLKNIPATARVVIAISKVNQQNRSVAADLAALLRADAGIDRAVLLRQSPS